MKYHTDIFCLYFDVAVYNIFPSFWLLNMTITPSLVRLALAMTILRISRSISICKNVTFPSNEPGKLENLNSGLGFGTISPQCGNEFLVCLRLISIVSCICHSKFCQFQRLLTWIDIQAQIYAFIDFSSDFSDHVKQRSLQR